MAAAELTGMEGEIETLVAQLKSSNQQLAELLQLSEDAKALVEKDIRRIDEKMSNTLQLFEILTRQELAHLAQQQQQCALKEIEEFTAKLADMHLMEHVLETLVDRFFTELEDYRERRKVSRAITHMDLSTAFAGPRPQSVCSVLTHLVRQKKAAREVAMIFVYAVNPPIASGLPPSPLVVPPPSMLRAAAASWKARTDVYGHKATSYSVVRVEGSLVEVFTVPFLESERLTFEATEELRVAQPNDFGDRLADAINEANLSGSADNSSFSLVVYLGTIQEDHVRPPPTRTLSQNRLLFVRHMVNHLEPTNKELATVWDRLQTQLRFIDAAGAAIKEGISNGEAVQLTVRRLDVEILCFSAPIEAPPCRRDPHLREAFHYMQIRLTRIHGGFVLPDDSIVAAALTSLVRLVHAGGPSCPVIISTRVLRRKRFWQRQAYGAAFEMDTVDSQRPWSPSTAAGGAVGGRGRQNNRSSPTGGSLPPGGGSISQGTPSSSGNLPCYVGAPSPLCPVAAGGSTAREVKGIGLSEAIAALAKTAEGVVLLSEPWTRGYTLYVHVCIKGTTC